MTVVTAAVIICNHRILICQRPRGKSLPLAWEFPGGKLESGETLPQCLKRELREELELDCKIGEAFMTSSFDYDFGTIELHAYFVRLKEQPQLTLHAHEQCRWVSPAELDQYDFPPADRPFIQALQSLKL